MSNKTTVEEICKDVPQSLLDSPVSDIHILDIASRIIKDWQEIAPHLDICETEEKDILDTNPKRPKCQRQEALRLWKEKNGPKATYLELIRVLHLQGLVNTAYKVKELALKSETIFASTCTPYVLNVFKNYLLDCYSELPHPASSQWPFSLSTTYTELDLYDMPVHPKENTKFENANTVPLKSILSTPKLKGKRKIILLEGVAGVGKTTLSWYACKEWAAGSIFEDVNLLIFVSLSDPDVHSAKKLADIIPDEREDIQTSVAAAIVESRGEGVCFWLEGCDEAPSTIWDSKSFLSNFITGNRVRVFIPSASIILTSRPTIPLLLSKCLTRKIVIKGFKSLDAYFDSVFQKENKLLEVLEMKPELRSLCHLPLNAAILVHVHDILKDELPSTRTGLFDPLLRNFLLRHMSTRTKYELESIDDYSTDLPSDIYSSLTRVAKLAYELLLLQNKVINKKTLRSFGITDADKMLGLLRGQMSITLNGPTQFFEFLHLSLQEFLAAFHIHSEMEELDQIEAVRRVYEQNPVSPVLTFYAGLTQLKNISVFKMLNEILLQRPNLTKMGKALSTDFKPSSDDRRKLLALMNCVYETQDPSLFKRITLVRQTLNESSDIYAQRSSLPVSTKENPNAETNSDRIQCNVELPLVKLDLYPTDCLSIAYFVRCASAYNDERIRLNLNACNLGYREMKALACELKVPVQNQTLILDIAEIYLTKKTLQLLKDIYNPQSCLIGIQADGCFFEDVQLVLQYLTEWLFHTSAKDSIIQIIPSNFAPSNIHYLILMVRGYCLNTLQLSSPLFGNYKFMSLFCEALKYSRVLNLQLNGSSIGDSSLLLLASAICETKTELTILHIFDNPYTKHGLTKFFMCLLKDFATVDLVQIILDGHNLTEDHWKNIV